MSAAFEVLDGGLQTTVQDLGRTGHLAIGVPRSGALDVPSYRLANRLAGNDDGEAALEMRSPGPALRLRGGSARIALTGTSAGLVIERGGAVEQWPSWRTVDVGDGDVIRVAPFADTAVAYLAVSGGFAIEPSLGARSTFLRGALGGIDGRALTAGGDLPLRRATSPEGPCRTLLRPPTFVRAPVLRVLPGPQADHFTADARRAFIERPFAVTRDIDRMGMRFEGPRLAHTGGADIVSDATVPGAIQVPGAGQPILLLNDCQTTGGYPKIAVVISTDLPSAARLLPGDEVRFREVSMADAEEARADAEFLFRTMAASMAVVRTAVKL